MTQDQDDQDGAQTAEVIALLNQVGATLHAQAAALELLTAKLAEISAGLQALAAAVALQPRIDGKRLRRDYATLSAQIAVNERVHADLARVGELLRPPTKDN